MKANRSYSLPMPIWRCPHCGTPQAESARCWVCHRSSTTCLTCRHFRRSVVVKLGLCGIDPVRQPLLGDEIEPCWESLPAETPQPRPGSAPRRAVTTPMFLELDAT